MAKSPDTPKTPPKKRAKTPAAKPGAGRPEVKPIGPALAELLNPAINRGDAGMGAVLRVLFQAGFGNGN